VNVDHSERFSDCVAHRVHEETLAMSTLECEVLYHEANEAHHVTCLPEHVSAYGLEVVIVVRRLSAFETARRYFPPVASSVERLWATVRVKGTSSLNC
jgi:hypothetical protein